MSFCVNITINKEVNDVYSAFFMPVQRVFYVLRYSLSSGVAFGDSRGVFERFILGGWFILKKGVGKLITKKILYIQKKQLKCV